MQTVSVFLSIASTVANRVLQALLRQRTTDRERSLPLSELINLTTTDDYYRRGFHREIEAIADSVSQRLDSYITDEWSTCREYDRNAAIASVIDALSSADLSDDILLAVDVDPVRLSDQIAETIGADRVAANLGEPAGSLYLRLLQVSCTLLAQLIVELHPFVNRSIRELLSRTTGLSQQVDQILYRLPITSLSAPAGTQHDDEFEQRYLNRIATIYDSVELFGIDINRYRPSVPLTVAYISLCVKDDDESSERQDPDPWRPYPDGAEVPHSRHSASIEQAIARASRTLIRGEAGSGKTTMLSWLAITGARRSFARELERWNGKVPFIIKLRRYINKDLPAPGQFVQASAEVISELMPTGWAYRICEAGRGLLLVDGVDELPRLQRSKVRQWLCDLLREFPKITTVITSRPGAVDNNWLTREHFVSVSLDRMGPTDVRLLVDHWHDAMEVTNDLPCSREELIDYKRALLSRLQSTPHLQTLATNPLLCAMLCALNLDRHKVVPPDRMAVYEAAMEMLLERRDQERGVTVDSLPLSYSDKVQLLQYLAWRASVNGVAEVPRNTAIARFRERLRMMTTEAIAPDEILDKLVLRSGVIREPVIGRIDFVHRTFQEYLTAKEAADSGDIGLLIREAHQDSWHEIIVMAVGHGNVPFREELLEGLLDRADSEPEHRRILQIVAAACLETAGTLNPKLRRRIEKLLRKLLPPSNSSEMVMMISAGAAVLRNAPPGIRSRSGVDQHAMIRLIAQIGGKDSLAVLGRYAESGDKPLFGALFNLCYYFEPSEYVDKVLSRGQVPEYLPFIGNRIESSCVRALRNVERIGRLQLYGVTDVGVEVVGLPPLEEVWFNGPFKSVRDLARMSESLRSVTVWTPEIENLEDFSHIEALRQLRLGLTFPYSVDFLRSIPQLELLWLHGLGDDCDLEAVKSLKMLTMLRLATSLAVLPSISMLADMPSLEKLEIYHAAPPGGMREIAELRQISSLALCESDWLRDSGDLPLFRHLRSLEIDSVELHDIGPLRELPNLESLNLSVPSVRDFRALLEMPALQHVVIRGNFDTDWDRAVRSQLRGLGTGLTIK